MTDYLWSIPGFEAYYTALEDAAREDADSHEHMRVMMSLKLKITPLRLFLIITMRTDSIIKLRTGSTYTRGFCDIFVELRHPNVLCRILRMLS